MKYCKICLTTSLRPNAEFDKNGVCIACNFENSSIKPNFFVNKNFLCKKIDSILEMSNSKRQYDCIVGVSGGKDSVRQAQWVRDNLNLKTLLICCAYPPLQMSNLGGLNINNLIRLGFDFEIFTPSPKSSKKLSKRSFFDFGNVCKHTEKALFSIVTRIAIEKKIPLVFWGENPSIQEGDAGSMGSDIFDANSIYQLNTLSSGGDDWVIKTVGRKKSDPYIFPKKGLKKSKLSMLFLGPAWNDWSISTNSAHASLNGLHLRPNDEMETGDISNASMLDENFTNINMMIKYFKFGFGRASDFVNERIRKNICTRSEGIKLVEKYDGICSDSIITQYCDYIEIKEKDFWENINKWANKNLFHLSSKQRPFPRFRVGEDFNG